MGVIGSLFSGIFGASSANNAANVQANAANNAANLQHQDAQAALDFQKQQYGNSMQLLSPWLNTGTGALNNLSYLMGVTPQSPFGAQRPSGSAGASNLAGLFGGNNAPSPVPGGQFLSANAYGGQVPLLGNGTTTNAGGTGQVPITGAPGSSSPANPSQGALNPNDPSGTNPLNASNGTGQVPLSSLMPGGTINASTNQGGTGQVPLLPSAPNGGGFGSLAQGWNQTFNAPTNVTEQNDPGYQFRLQQGMDALQRSAAAQGGLLTGGTAKAINDYAQNSASGEYQNVYNRALQGYNTNYNTFTNDQTNTFNRLAALSGLGQTSAAQLSSAGQGAANNAGNILLTSGGQIGGDLQNAAAARASGYIGGANAINGTVNSLGSLASLFGLMG